MSIRKPDSITFQNTQKKNKTKKTKDHQQIITKSHRVPQNGQQDYRGGQRQDRHRTAHQGRYFQTQRQTLKRAKIKKQSSQVMKTLFKK